MTTEVVLSPVKDEKMNSNINDSPVWKKAYKPEEVTEEIRNKHNHWYKYQIKFDGLRAIQVTKFEEI
jgi:hypothetical protein